MISVIKTSPETPHENQNYLIMNMDYAFDFHPDSYLYKECNKSKPILEKLLDFLEEGRDPFTTRDTRDSSLARNITYGR
ncbi:hypothetical protein CEXT_248261 [Caerostris extrusa]|uniref:Uncharacterized protein n=1 Tax=Caerostris extrusa TaxID=172846 RepID=A0AAV4XRM1_CAEEX|nr:hypothetical protein CEXT_248261 [Caerostris extrusa]